MSKGLVSLNSERRELLEQLWKTHIVPRAAVDEHSTKDLLILKGVAEVKHVVPGLIIRYLIKRSQKGQKL